MALAILRMPNGMDYSYLNLEVNNDLTFSGLDSPTMNQSHSSLAATGELILSGNRNLMHADSNLNLAGMASSQTTITTPQQRKNSDRQRIDLILISFVICSQNRFRIRNACEN